MKRVLFIQNGEHDGPGLFAKTLHECRVEMITAHPWRNEPIPDLEGFDGLAIGGGGISAYETDKYPFLAAELMLLQSARATRKPVLGMCLGAQLMASAFGGEVFPNGCKEIGFYEVRLTEAAKADPLWTDCNTSFQPVHWHGDTFTLPPGAALLASSDLTPNQLFVLDQNLYALQFHLEIDLGVLTRMVSADDGELGANGVDPDILLRTADKILPAVEPLAHTVFSRWANLLFTESPRPESPLPSQDAI